MGKEIEALVIVHLSSLDAYTAMMHDVWGHFDNGEQLGQEMTKAIFEHPGPVYIIDQGWGLGRRESRPREELLKAVKARSDIKWLSFDEDVSDWEDFLPYFRRRLRREGVTSAILGGVWYAANEESGCVTRVLQDLREIMPAKVNDSIVGCESEADEEEAVEEL